VNRRRAIRWLQIGGTLACLIWLVWRLDLEEVGSLLSRPRWFYVALCFSLTPLLILVSVWRWQLLLRARGAAPPSLELVRLYVICIFFNQFAPSTLGGDAFRIYATGKSSALPLEITAASVIVDRLSGLAVVGVAAVPGWFVLAARSGRTQWFLVPLALALAAAGVLWGVARGEAGLSSAALPERWIDRVLATATAWRCSIREYRTVPGTLIAALALSILFLVLCGFNYWCGALAFQGSVGAGKVFLVIPCILLLGNLPVSVAGLGLQEASAAVLFQAVGLDASVGLSAALLLRCKNLLLALIGGGLYLSAAPARVPRP